MTEFKYGAECEVIKGFYKGQQVVVKTPNWRRFIFWGERKYECDFVNITLKNLGIPFFKTFRESELRLIK